MQPESPTYLWDARRAAGLVHQFVSGRTFVEYTDDSMLRSAVERQFGVVGEALNRLRRVDPETAAQIPDLARIIAFRNVIIHGYATVDDNLVWHVATSRVGILIDALDRLLTEASS